jgi:hypothetical protein
MEISLRWVYSRARAKSPGSEADNPLSVLIRCWEQAAPAEISCWFSTFFRFAFLRA